MRIRGFVKAVAELLGDRVPSYRRHPRRWGAMGLDLSRTEIQSLEQRLVLAAPEIGDTTGEYDLSVDGFTSNVGIEVIGGVAYFPGRLGSAAAFKSLNLNAGRVGETGGESFSGTGEVYAVYQESGVVSFLVHPGLLWVEAESTAVEEDGSFEVLTVSEATDSSLDGHDFAVHAFGDGVRDSVSAIAHDILQTFLDGSCDGLHWLEFCVNHSLVPVVEISCR